MNRLKTYLITMMICAGATYVQAQDTPLPTADLYDSGMMNMAIQSRAQTYSIRRQQYDQCWDMALTAMENGDLRSVITHVTNALSTGFWSGNIYYLRGFAYEKLGEYSLAKKDYKSAKRNGCELADEALERLKREHP